MKKLAILLAVCLIITSLSACKSKPLDMTDKTPVPDTDTDTDVSQNGDKEDNTDSEDKNDKNPELDFDDVPVPVKQGIEGRVTEASINVRETPGTKGKALGTVEKGKDLLISKIQGVDSVLWGYMGEGWVCLDYVAFDMDRNGTIVLGTTTDNLQAREAPHTFCETVDKVPKGTRFEISAFACFGTAIWGLTPAGWLCLNYASLDRGVEIVEGENAEELDPFYLAPDYKEKIPKSDEAVAPTAESVIGTWRFVTLTGFYSTIYEEYFNAVQGYVILNDDGTFICGYDDYVSTLYSTETSVKSWDISTPGKVELGGTYEVTEEGIVLSYTYSRDVEGDEVVEDMSKTVTLKLTQKDDKLFIKNPKDILYTNEKGAAKITHPVLYFGVDGSSGELLETVYPGTYY